MRFQGIGNRNLEGPSPNKVREMVGNSMHVGTVSAVIRAVFQILEGFDSCAYDEETAATSEISVSNAYVAKVFGFVSNDPESKKVTESVLRGTSSNYISRISE